MQKLKIEQKEEIKAIKRFQRDLKIKKKAEKILQ